EQAERERLAALEAEKERRYNEAITNADNLFGQNEYENARTEYRAALNVKPDETYPQQKIDEIATLLAQLSAAQKAYEEAVANGDREFRRESFDLAKTAYNEATLAKPAETYPGEMIAQIDSITDTRARLAAEAEQAERERLAALEAEKESRYNEAITNADNLFGQNEYENARTEYRAALNIKQDETYPQQKIDEIATLLAQLSAAQKAYEEAVANGDREFRRESFDLAKTAYNEATLAKPAETYPGEMIAQIDSITDTRARLAAEAEQAERERLAALEAEKERRYNEAITNADNLFGQNEYESARTEYRAALNIKQDETYPQQKIDEIATLLAQLSAAQKAYEEAVANGDREFRRESFDLAKTAYNEATLAKPAETYPGEMIAQIDSITDTRARLAAEAEQAERERLAALEAEKERRYNEAITNADNLFGQNEYENARTEYRAALNVKPDETYPQQKIDEIATLLAQLSAAQKAYEEAVANGDREFRRESFDLAKTAYNEATLAKPAETYPGEMIAQIDSITDTRARLAAEAEQAERERLAALEAEKERRYNEAITNADNSFDQNEYENARTEYRAALNIKQDETYPKNQIIKIDDILQKERERILAEQSNVAVVQAVETQTNQANAVFGEQDISSEAGLAGLYNEYIETADALFVEKQYNVSRAWYYTAWDVKPEETYPFLQIEEINRLIGSLLLSQRDRNYQQFVDLADSTFRENQLAVARGWYNRALSEKADEIYPKNQLQEIQKKIAERLAGQSGAQFDSHVEKAASAFAGRNFNVSRFWYKKALELRPNDLNVKNRLREIEEALK
ncbi:MAG: hypothetical protein HN410_11965, partial [Prolixibacteraceae bacterium]|nr:hypothetical protein [Prolixibacteraceae bacterium]